MTLLECQNYFSGKVSLLIQKAQSMGYLVTLGEAWRPPQMAAIYASTGAGIKNSNHCMRMAIDIILIDGTKYLKDSLDYEPLGSWWEKQSSEGQTLCWGGRWNDGNHFSLLHEGVQ